MFMAMIKKIKTFDHEPNPKNYYGLSKLICEKILYNYYIRTKIMSIF